METEVLAVAGGPDMSFLGLVEKAGIVVKLTMALLLLASFWSWAIVVDKWLAFRKARREAAMFEEAFWSGQPLDALYDRIGQKPRSAIERVFAAGMGEWRRSFDKSGSLIAGARDRIERSLDVALARESEEFSTRLGFLATVGAIAPFVGLFGTVWGIMTTFQQIAARQDTNLATVAPGIAEALIATAIGLVAAIPAVVFYNKLSGDHAKLSGQLEAFADEFSVILSRQLMRSAA